jgi:hypothetical protein
MGDAQHEQCVPKSVSTSHDELSHYKETVRVKWVYCKILSQKVSADTVKVTFVLKKHVIKTYGKLQITVPCINTY